MRIHSQSVAWLNGQAWRDLEKANGPTAGLSLMFQVSGFIQLVGGESNSYAFIYLFSLCLVGEVPGSQPIMTSLQQKSKEETGVFPSYAVFSLTLFAHATDNPKGALTV